MILFCDIYSIKEKIYHPIFDVLINLKKQTLMMISKQFFILEHFYNKLLIALGITLTPLPKFTHFLSVSINENFLA